VGHDPISRPELRGVDGASWNDKRRCDFVTKGFQVSKYSSEPHIVDPRRVFKKTPIGPCFGNDSKSLRPEPAHVSLASLLPGTTRWLAWNSCREEKPPSPSGSVEVPDVGNDRNPWICPFEEFLAPFVFLTKYLRFNPCPLASKGKAPYP